MCKHTHILFLFYLFGIALLTRHRIKALPAKVLTHAVPCTRLSRWLNPDDDRCVLQPSRQLHQLKAELADSIRNNAHLYNILFCSPVYYR